MNINLNGDKTDLMDSKCIFISADHGLAVVYFLQSDIVPRLIQSGVKVVVLTDDGLTTQLEKRFGQPGLYIEGLRMERLRSYYHNNAPTLQWWLHFLRRVGASNRINLEAMVSHIRQVDFEAKGKRRLLMPLMKFIIGLLRRSKIARQTLVNLQMLFTTDVYTDLFEKYDPQLVVASTAGWRWDRYLLREAKKRKIETTAAIVGWDNPSSYSLPGAPMDWVNCWSELQKSELVDGSDWQPEKIHIGGIPSYDGYFRKEWLIDRDEYFKLHGLDPDRKLLGYACSFITFSPNYQNIEAIAQLVANDALNQPSQLLIRLHPNHFMDEPLFVEERQKVMKLVEDLPNVHVVEPVPLGGELGYYSGEDMPEKTSMMAHSDIFLTVYSTMVVEAAVHDSPIVSVVIDAEGGWNKPGRFSLALSEIGEWPTHERFRLSGAGLVAADKEQLKKAINFYINNPDAHRDKRQKFINKECTFTDGESGVRTAEFLLSII